MEEADALSDRIGIMAYGALRCLGRSLHLKAKFGAGPKVDLVVRDGMREAAIAFVQATCHLAGHGCRGSFARGRRRGGLIGRRRDTYQPATPRPAQPAGCAAYDGPRARLDASLRAVRCNECTPGEQRHRAMGAAADHHGRGARATVPLHPPPPCSLICPPSQPMLLAATPQSASYRSPRNVTAWRT